MARKKKGDAASSVTSVVSPFLQSIVGGLLGSVVDTAKTRADEIARHVSRLLLYTFLLLAAAVFVVVGAVMIVQEYYYFNPGWVFVAGAALMVFWALLTRIQIEKER